MTNDKKNLTLHIGVFFDGTGQNANNIINLTNYESVLMNEFTDSVVQTESFLNVLNERGREIPKKEFTNIFYLYELYNSFYSEKESCGQVGMYIEGVGTDNGKQDNIISIVTGMGSSGIVSKAESVASKLIVSMKEFLVKIKDKSRFIDIKIQFDIFGFSRGGAAARHFANMVTVKDETLFASVKKCFEQIEYESITMNNRFIGLFDSVISLCSMESDFNPNNLDKETAMLTLDRNVATSVFQITAKHEFRYNYPLMSVRPVWPEIALPGAHSDIGGGYQPLEEELYFLTRPVYETVLASLEDTKTAVYKKAEESLKDIKTNENIETLINNDNTRIITWHDDRLPQDRYGNKKKRSSAAVVIEKKTKNDWSKVVLQVMLDAACECGCVFEDISKGWHSLDIPLELKPYLIKALSLSRDVRRGVNVNEFLAEEIRFLASEYIHISANWNAVHVGDNGNVTEAVKPVEVINFVNRPDYLWGRTIFNNFGSKI